MPIDNDGIMVILSSPSGAGKTTLVNLLSKTKDFEVEYDPQTNFKHITIHSSLLHDDEISALWKILGRIADDPQVAACSRAADKRRPRLRSRDGRALQSSRREEWRAGGLAPQRVGVRAGGCLSSPRRLDAPRAVAVPQHRALGLPVVRRLPGSGASGGGRHAQRQHVLPADTPSLRAELLQLSAQRP